MSLNKQQAYDLDAMNDAADEWGPSDDPSRADFIQGWRHQRAGPRDTPNPSDVPDELCAKAAYQSGFIAARETP